MPTDATAANYRNEHVNAERADQVSGRSLPDGAGLAIGVIAGTAIWGGALALFLLL